MQQGRYAEACEKLAESQRLQPKAATLGNLAACHEANGELGLAWVEFSQVLEMAQHQARADRVVAARKQVAALTARVYLLTIHLPDASSDVQLDLRREGDPVPLVFHRGVVALLPGTYLLTATGRGSRPWHAKVVALAGERGSIDVPRFEPEAPLVAPPPERQTPPPAAAVTSSGRRESFFRPGAFARVDVEGQGRGAVGVVGLVAALGPFVELGVAALLGEAQGLWAGGTVYLLRGAWRPLLQAGVPVFWVDGARPGIQGSGGVEWRPHRRLGISLSLGVVYFPTAAAGKERTVFVPSIGVAGRL